MTVILCITKTVAFFQDVHIVRLRQVCSDTRHMFPRDWSQCWREPGAGTLEGVLPCALFSTCFYWLSKISKMGGRKKEPGLGKRCKQYPLWWGPSIEVGLGRSKGKYTCLLEDLVPQVKNGNMCFYAEICVWLFCCLSFWRQRTSGCEVHRIGVLNCFSHLMAKMLSVWSCAAGNHDI